MLPADLLGSLFEAILAPSWSQVGSKVEFWRVGNWSGENPGPGGSGRLKEQFQNGK